MIVVTSVMQTAVSWLAALSYAALALGHARMTALPRRWLAIGAWLLHALALLLMWLQPEPRLGFAVAISITMWLATTVYAVEVRLLPELRVHWAMALLGALAVLLAWWFPGKPHTGLSTFLAPLHSALGFASYALLGMAALHGWQMQRAERAMRHAQPTSGDLPLLALERLTFRFLHLGFALLSATLVVGIGFSESLFGVAWRADHKTLLSVLGWVVFATLIVGRAALGWRGRVAMRLLYGGLTLLVLGYIGSRFVLEVLLQR